MHHHDLATSRLLNGAVLRLKVHIPFSVSTLPFQACREHPLTAQTFQNNCCGIIKPWAQSGQKKNPNMFSSAGCSNKHPDNIPTKDG